jgi:hypothetical protein
MPLNDLNQSLHGNRFHEQYIECGIDREIKVGICNPA